MQSAMLFTLPPVIGEGTSRSSADWRGIWVAAGVGTLDAWNGIRTVSTRELLWLIAATPAANQWIHDHCDAIAGVIADVVGAAVPMELRQRQIGVRASSQDLHAYLIPRFVADKKARGWAEQMQPSLAPEIITRLTSQIESGIRRELSAWGRLPAVLEDQPSFVAISDPGRAIPVSAIRAGGSGKPISVLIRQNVTFLSYFRIEGALSLGPLASLGYGRMIRTGVPASFSVALQRQLMNIQPQLQEL